MITLTENQEQVVQEGVNWFLNSSNQIFEISGAAGTGKSVVLHEIVSRLHLTDNDILPVAFTGQAAIIMRMKGFSTARTIHSTFFHIVKEPVSSNDPFKRYNTAINRAKYITKFEPLPVGVYRNKKLIVIDEGYMVPDNLKRIIVKHGIKILVAGDVNQLPPVGGSPAFLTGYGVHYLTQIMRQEKDNPIIYLAERARQGLPINCGIYGNNVIVIEDNDLSPKMLANFGIVICGTNRTRDIFNNTVREFLGYQNLPYPQFNERVICRENDWDIEQDGIALANGLAGIVSSPYSISSFNQRKHTFYFNFLPDLLSIPFQQLEVNSEYIVSDYNVRSQIKKDKVDKPWLVPGELFEYAYALTTHLSQGSEYPAGIYYEEYLRSDIQNQLNYTGITRFKQYLVYCKKTKKYYAFQ